VNSIQVDPDYATAHQRYAKNLAWQGRSEEALVQSERARQLDPMSVIVAVDDVDAKSGKTKEANEALAKFEQTAPRSRSDWRAAELYAYVGTERKEQVIKLLQSAYSEHSNAIANLKVDPIYDPLRGDPEFRKLLRQLNFPNN
jgi:tetratricopeptide (TPR) repeat protein